LKESKTYVSDTTSNLSKSGNGREITQVFNDCVLALHQPQAGLGAVTKCPGMLLKDLTDSACRVTMLDLDGEWIFHKILSVRLVYSTRAALVISSVEEGFGDIAYGYSDGMLRVDGKGDSE